MADEEKHKCPPHFWLIDSEGIGHCRYCPAIKDFGGARRKLDEGKTEKASQAGRKSKRGRLNPYGKRGRPPKYA